MELELVGTADFKLVGGISGGSLDLMFERKYKTISHFSTLQVP